MYTTDTSQSPRDIAQYFDQAGQLARAQFQRVGVDPALWDAMLNVPAEEMQFLSPQERSKFRLIGQSPARLDAEDSEEAKAVKLSKAEYLKRKARHQECMKAVWSADVEGDNWWNKCRVKAGLPPDPTLGPDPR